MKPELKTVLEKQHYRLVGHHSGVKLCHWMRQSLLFNRNCYKQTFYGIKSHQCLQMTPAITQCTHMCLFCWRYQRFTEQQYSSVDDPVEVLEQSILAQKKLITGFHGDPRCDQKKYKEAQTPRMVACSLSGEPTLYPRLGEFFEACKKKKMTTFLVTNGTQPEVLEHLDPLPTQLYVSVVASDETMYKKLCVPLIPDGWERIMKTLALLPSLDTRTVIRHTLVQNWNMTEKSVEQFANLDKKAEPQFIEPKGYVLVGDSRNRMRIENMPSHEAVHMFGSSLATKLGYELVMEKEDSLVVLLTNKPKNVKLQLD